MWPNAWFADLQRTKAKATPSPTQLTTTMPSSSYSDWQLTPTRPSYAELCQATSYAGLHMAAIAINRSRRFCQTLFHTSSEFRATYIMMYIFWQILRITNIRTKRSKQMLLIDRAIIIDSPSMTHLDCWHQSKSGTKIWHVYRHANHQPSSASYSPQPTNSSSGLHRWLILRANKNTQTQWWTHFHSHKARNKDKSERSTTPQ